MYAAGDGGDEYVYSEDGNLAECIDEGLESAGRASCMLSKERIFCRDCWKGLRTLKQGIWGMSMCTMRMATWQSTSTRASSRTRWTSSSWKSSQEKMKVRGRDLVRSGSSMAALVLTLYASPKGFLAN